MCLLASAQMMSFIDRFVLSLLITPIKQALALSDFQIGLLLGPAFAICFAVFGVPMGWLADRKNRTTIIASGIVLWSAMTAACGLARSFGALFVARIGVGLGEAALNPSVVSLVSDYFPRDHRSRAMGFYMTSAFIGAGAAYIVGGQAVQIIASWPPLSVPLIGELMAWQTAFIVISAPGFIIAALIFLTPEPPRRGTPDTAVSAMSFSQAHRHFSLHWRSYTCVFIGMAGTTAISAASFWSPALFERTWGWNVDRTGLVIGFVILLGGIPGANLGGLAVRQIHPPPRRRPPANLPDRQHRHVSGLRALSADAQRRTGSGADVARVFRIGNVRRGEPQRRRCHNAQRP